MKTAQRENRPASARRTALEALRRVEYGDGYSNLVLDAALKRAGLSPADGALASALFYGVLERRITLDSYLQGLIKGKASPYLRDCLRLGLYQILYMDKVPDAAAVHETVELVKASKESRAAGLCNAVLRQAIRRKATLLPPEGDTPAAVGVRYACPTWLAQNLIGDYGLPAAEAFLADALNPPPVYIRANTLRTTADALLNTLVQQGIEAEAGSLPGSIRLREPGSLEGNPLYKQGLFHVQDLASQYCAALVDPRPGERVLDLCAAPGGKSFTLAQRMGDAGVLISCDIHPKRVGLIRQGAERLGITCLTACQNDAGIWNPALLEAGAAVPAPFDRVLCDVPCSGFGIIRRKPDVKYKEPDSLKGLPTLQLTILENGSRYVKPGGRLVYSTCTLRRAENQKVCGRFLKAHPEFAAESVPGMASACADDPPGFYTFMPHTHASDGFFAAVFRRKA